MSCHICGDECGGRWTCRPCYQYLYARLVRRHRRNRRGEAAPIVVKIEQEIARGTPTVAIMSLLDVEYAAVKSVRDDMDAAERNSGDAA